MWLFLGMMALQAFSSIKQGQAQAQQAKFAEREALANAAQAKADAAESERIGQLEAMETLAEQERIKGAARVSRAGGGGRTDTGTNWLLSIQDANLAEFEVWKTGYQARRRTDNYTTESLGYIRQAGQYKIAAKNAKTMGFLGAATGVLGGLAMGTKAGMFDKAPAGAGLSGWGSRVVKSPSSTWGQGIRPPTA